MFDEADETLFQRFVANNKLRPRAAVLPAGPITLAIQLEDGRPQWRTYYQVVATINDRDFLYTHVTLKELPKENFLGHRLPSYFYAGYIVNALNVLSCVW